MSDGAGFPIRCPLCNKDRVVWPGGILICDHCENVYPCCYDMHFQGREAGVVQVLVPWGPDGYSWRDRPWGDLPDIVPNRRNHPNSGLT